MFSTRQEVIEKLMNKNESEISTVASSSSSCASERETTPSSLPRQREWKDPEKFIEDNMHEVYDKLPNLEKQIWGKLIVMEGNRRTAKAYLRHPLVTIDGSEAEFDGLRIGLSRFENPDRSSILYEIFTDILAGVKVKIDPDGNLWAKRACFSPVFLKPLYRNRPNDLFVIDQRPAKVFDIKRFKEVLVHELKQPAPDRRKLEKCCLVCLKFSFDHNDLLKTPCWIVIVHLVAIELLNLVLPIDNELSSPSSSFTASPATPLDLKQARHFGKNSNEKETARRLYAKHHRDSSKFVSPEKHHGHWPVEYGPNFSPRPVSVDPADHFQRRRESSSMVDLRLPPAETFFPGHHKEMRHEQWQDVHQHWPRVSVIPRRPHMGVRVSSMEGMNGNHFSFSGRPPYRTERKAMPGQIERLHLQKWRSQDSGIASASGSYGKK